MNKTTVTYNDNTFDIIKELYNPVFSKALTEEQIKEAKDTFKRLNFKVLFRNKILDYIPDDGYNVLKQAGWYEGGRLILTFCLKNVWRMMFIRQIFKSPLYGSLEESGAVTLTMWVL